jgi:hypothetical protein
MKSYSVNQIYFKRKAPGRLNSTDHDQLLIYNKPVIIQEEQGGRGTLLFRRRISLKKQSCRVRNQISQELQLGMQMDVMLLNFSGTITLVNTVTRHLTMRFTMILHENTAYTMHKLLLDNARRR